MYKSDILFTGYYGHQNTGDDAFIEVASWGAKKYWNKNKIRFLGDSTKLPIVLEPVKGYPFSIPRSYRFQRYYLINNADYLISAGGSTIHSKMKSYNPKAIALRKKNSGKDIKIGGIGISIGPFESLNDEKAVIEYLKNIDFLAVRDQTSFDFVSSLDLPYTPVNAFDLAALLPNIYNYSYDLKEINKSKTIGVSICPYESLKDRLNLRNEEKRNLKTVQLLKSIEEKDQVHFKFYIINGNPRVGDYNLTLNIINQVRPKSYEIIHYSKQIKGIWKSIANCDFMISTRLHAAIFACFSDTPFMLNEYHRKCSDFLDNVGYHSSYRLFDSNYDPNERAENIIEILNNKEIYKKPNNVFKMKQLSLLNFTEIKL